MAEQEHTINALAWTQGVPWYIQHLRRLAAHSPAGFNALIQHFGDRDRAGHILERYTTIALCDEAAAIRVLQMPFLNGEHLGVVDGDALSALVRLAMSDLDGLQRVLDHPEVRNGITSEEAPLVLLLSLEQENPAAAAAIRAVPWVEDGITQIPPIHYINFRRDPAEYEHASVADLVTLARYAGKTFAALLEKPWVQDGYTVLENQVVLKVKAIAFRNDEAAARIVGMPFLASLGEDRTPFGILQILQDLAEFDATLLQQLLSSPELRGGITNEHSTILRLLHLELQDPDAAAALNALPWVQDGIDASDRSGIAAMRWVALYSKELFHLLATRSWVQDGLTPGESRMFYSLALLTRESLDRASEEVTLQITEREVTLPLAGGVTSLAIWPRNEVSAPQASHTLDLLEDAVRVQEDFIGIPYPNRYAFVLILDKEERTAGAATTVGAGGLIMIDPPYSDSADIVAHEAAHTYWPHLYLPWIEEGVASFLDSITARARTGEPLPEPVDSCSLANNIVELESLPIGVDVYSSGCNYTLGESLFLDLYRGLGDEAFRQGFTELNGFLWDDVRRGECDGQERGVCYLKAAFVTGANPRDAAIAEEIINRRYYGTSN